MFRMLMSSVPAGVFTDARPGGLLLMVALLLATAVWSVAGADAVRNRRRRSRDVA